MRKQKQSAAVIAAVLTAGMTFSAAAAETTFSIDMNGTNEDAWKNVAMANDDTVSTGALIRKDANEDGQIVGYLYRGGAVNVLWKGDNWTEVESGGVRGYINNNCLVYGDEAKGLAEHYGEYAVEASWNDVNVFAEGDANAKILETAGDGDTYKVVCKDGHWVEVKTQDDRTAFVSEDDVNLVILTDTAVDVNGERPSSGASSSAETYYEEASYEASYAEPTYAEPSYQEPAYTEPAYTEPSYQEPVYQETEAAQDYYDDGSNADTSYDDYQEEYSGDYTEETYSDSTAADTYEDTSADDEIYEDVDDAEYYDDSSYDDTVYDDSSYDESYDESGSDSSSSASSSDLDLLAAIIYHEAGNQPTEGKIAVGAVVLNRVYSGSFPNTISEVLYQPGQFTPASELAGTIASGVPSDCYDAANAALAGQDPTGGCLYFNTSHGSGVHIGAHWFY